MKTTLKAWIGIAMALTMLVAGAVMVVGPDPLAAQGGISNFDTIVASGDVLVGDDLTITDQANINDMVMTERTGITLTSGATLTPLGSAQPVRAAGNIGFGAIGACAAGTAGQLLVVINDTNTTIVLTDSATLNLTGNLSLGQDDTALLYCNGAEWAQLATANN